MFTGIVDHCGKIVALRDEKTFRSFCIESQFQELKLGESIAVDGVCLTITAIQNYLFNCEASPETLKLTTLGKFKIGDSVNLERSLTPSDRMGGHFVTGHVDQVATVKLIQPHNEFIEIEFSNINTDTKKLLVKKGSVAVNGVSLTLNEVVGNSFKVMLIPHTLANTNLSLLKTGDDVNIEYDLLAKLVAKQLAEREIA